MKPNGLFLEEKKDANLVRATEHLYDKVLSTVHVNGSLGEWFRKTV